MIFADIYCRVSTQEQTEGYSLAEQEDRLKKFCDAQGWIVHRVCTDGGFSGASLHRPAMTEMLDDVRNKRIQKIVVYKLDRLSRSQKDTLYLIQDVFLPNCVDLVSMCENVSMNSSFGQAMVGIMSCFAELERSTIKERMTIGRDARVKDGKYRGSGHIPIGFTYSEGLLHEDEYDASMVRFMFDSYAAGETASSIANALNTVYHFRHCKWTANKVKKILQQPLYIGRQRYKNEEFTVTDCPKIVEEETWLKVQKEIARRNAGEKPQSPYKHTTMLGGILWCGCCGNRFTGCSDINSKGERIHRYYCYGRILKNHHMTTEACCNRSWNAKELDQLILDEIKKIRFTGTAPVSRTSEQEHVIEARLRSLEDQKNRLIDLYAFGSIDIESIQKKAEAIKEEQEALKTRLDSIRQPEGSLDGSDLQEALEAFAGALDEDGDNLRFYGVVHQLIQYVTLEHDDVLIQWNF